MKEKETKNYESLSNSDGYLEVLIPIQFGLLQVKKLFRIYQVVLGRNCAMDLNDSKYVQLR